MEKTGLLAVQATLRMGPGIRGGDGTWREEWQQGIPRVCKKGPDRPLFFKKGPANGRFEIVAAILVELVAAEQNCGMAGRPQGLVSVLKLPQLIPLLLQRPRINTGANRGLCNISRT